MSQFVATISQISNVQNLNLVTFLFHNTNLKMMSLELPHDMAVNTKVLLHIKPTSVAIGKKLSGHLSDVNRLESTVVAIEEGALLSSVTLDSNGDTLEAIITKEAAAEMMLGVGDEVSAIFNASDLSIAEVLS
jgi:molybdopterin-binding protein